MPIYKLKSGKHHYRDSNGEIKVIKAGKTIECEPEFLSGTISRFEEVDSKNPTLKEDKKESSKKEFKRTKK